MTVCIYIMYWDINKPYIGQTVSYKKRVQVHTREIKNTTHCNSKVIAEYKKYGCMPTFDILEECSQEKLNYLEEFYIKDFDAIINGLNIISGGYSVGYGVNNPASKYNEEQLIEVYELLTDPHISLAEIANKTLVNISTVKKISQGVQHIWLAQSFPELHEKIQKVRELRNSISRSAIKHDKPYLRIQDPDGQIYTVTNTLHFANEHNLPNGNLCSVLLGKRRSVKGWIGVK
jgi:predicted GIY-YIG superfamily endonuclease